MDFIANVFSYIFYILWNFITGLLNLVPLGSIFSMLDSINADQVLTSLFTVFFSNANSTNMFVMLGSVIIIIFLLFFALGIAISGVKYLYGNIADYLFRQKYKDTEDRELGDIVNNNIIENMDISNRRKLKFNYKGFTGIILSRIHAWKEDKLGTRTNVEGKQIRYFGVLTFTLMYLFGFMNRKEVKEYNFHIMIFAVIAAIGVSLLVFTNSNIYHPGVYVIKDKYDNQISLNNVITISRGNTNVDGGNNVKVEKKYININLNNFSNVTNFVMLAILRQDLFKYDTSINSNNQIDLTESLVDEIISLSDGIKTNELAKKKFLANSSYYPDALIYYIKGNKSISSQEVKESLMKINPFVLLSISISLVDITLQINPNKNTIYGYTTMHNIAKAYNVFLGSMYKWKEYRSIYKVINENVGLVNLQKFIYTLGFLDLIEPDTKVKLKVAKEKVGILPPVKNEQVLENNNDINFLVGQDSNTQQKVNQIKKDIETIKKSAKLTSSETSNASTGSMYDEMYVANPDYVYKIFGIFPVYPLSTSKNVNVIYYLVLLILAFLQLFIILMFSGLGRFIYLYLTYTMLDANQKANYQIDWSVEFTDTLIRFVVVMIIYVYLVHNVMVFKVT